MGQSTWSKDAYADVSATRSKQSAAQNFVQSSVGKIHADLDPRGVDMRESRDSAAHPNSIAIIVGLDETGSMGDIPKYLITHKLGSLMDTIIDNGVPDPQIMFVGIGDHMADSAPLQVGQFESGTAELDACLSKIYLEGEGGGNGGESYPLVWYFAAAHTSIDCFEKRGEKGFIFTIGDEPFHEAYQHTVLKDKIGYAGGEDLNARALYDLACQSYNVFHIHTNDHRVYGHTTDQWRDLLNERLLLLPDRDLVAELIATTVAMVHGVHIDQATAHFDARTKNAVTTALATVKDSLAKRDSNQTGVIAI